MHSATMTTTPSPCRFPTVALSWAATLLRECDLEHHGVDLFGRDSFLLGRLLITLGMLCMACAVQEPHARYCLHVACDHAWGRQRVKVACVACTERSTFCCDLCSADSE